VRCASLRPGSLQRKSPAISACSEPPSIVGFVVRPAFVEDQPAIPDDIGRTLPLRRQKPRPQRAILFADLRGDVFLGRAPLEVYLSVRWYPHIPLYPQLTVDGRIGHPLAPQGEPGGLQGVHYGRRRHAQIISALAIDTRSEQRAGACAEKHDTGRGEGGEISELREGVDVAPKARALGHVEFDVARVAVLFGRAQPETQ